MGQSVRAIGKLAALALIATAALAGGFAPPGNASKASSGETSQYLTCGQPDTIKNQADRRVLQLYCANQRNAVTWKVNQEGGSKVRTRNLSSAISSKSSEVVGISPEMSSEAAFDNLVISNGDGSSVDAYYEQGSLFLNSPTEADFDPSLPVGVIALDPAVTAAKLDGGSTAARTTNAVIRSALAVSNNLTLVGSGCSEAWSGSHDNNNAYLQVCWTWYKPTNGDGDPDKAYRLVSSIGVSRGGNGNHVLEQATTRNQVTQGNICCDWSPNGCCTYPSPGETINWSVVLTPLGVGGTVSGSYTAYPDSVGQRYFSLDEDKHNYGWRGNKQCCTLIGHDGGFDLSFPQGGSWSFSGVPFIQWHN